MANRGFDPDPELSEILTKLWDLDTNKCYPGSDFQVDLQGYVKSGRALERDRAKYNLFEWVDEEKVFERKTYKTFKDLLDNYELECGEAEVVTPEEKKENIAFVDAIMETDVMQEAHKYLISKGKSPEHVGQFKWQLYKIWFSLVRRTRGDRDQDSSSFEHVFVGEGRDDKFIGLHNWIQFYLQEKAGNIDYHGYFRHSTVTDDEHFRLIALQFDWREEKGKPISSCFLGTSPEFEIAAYTICFLLDRLCKTDVQLGEYEVEIDVKPFAKNYIGTAYIAAARMY
ncbi:poly(U)-specific endoribonuclease-A-like [Mytilus trossulus]|uniref:poly(U)-specific endoribonuclease-A-like n=1 Tax=Mytilus trossulus TaxID=6551 RepID=UPI003005E38F